MGPGAPVARRCGHGESGADRTRTRHVLYQRAGDARGHGHAGRCEATAHARARHYMAPGACLARRAPARCATALAGTTTHGYDELAPALSRRCTGASMLFLFVSMIAPFITISSRMKCACRSQIKITNHRFGCACRSQITDAEQQQQQDWCAWPADAIASRIQCALSMPSVITSRVSPQ